MSFFGLTFFGLALAKHRRIQSSGASSCNAAAKPGTKTGTAPLPCTGGHDGVATLKDTAHCAASSVSAKFISPSAPSGGEGASIGLTQVNQPGHD